MLVDDPDWQDHSNAQAFEYASRFGEPAHRDDASGRRQCPQCGGTQVEQRHRARRIGGTIGTIAGAIGGVCRTLGGYEFGLAVGAATFGPPGAVLGAFSGAVISALMGGTTGWTIGTKLGAALDTSVLDNYRCLSCQHTFSPPVQT